MASKTREAATTAATTYGKGERRGKPSVTRRTAGRAVSGAATGAALGSVVPGVGTGIGAAVGAVAGGASGAVSAAKDKRAAAAPRSSAQRLLVAEFVICIVILALSPIAAEPGTTAGRDWMKRGSAMCGLFLVLGLISAIGPRAGRVAAAFGGIATVTLLVDQRGIFAKLTGLMASTGGAEPDEYGPPEDEPAAPPRQPDRPGTSPGVPA